MNQDDFNEAERRSKLRMQVIYEGSKKPKREWVGLTDEDISEIVRITHNTGSFARAIEQALKEKNT
jgi:Zn-finger domain-containing protein